MKPEDLVLFEIGEGFKRLSPNICNLLTEIFEEFLSDAEQWTFSTDGALDEATDRFFEYTKNIFKEDDAAFIEAIGFHDDWGLFGPALSHIGENNEIYKYAKEYFREKIREDTQDEEFIEELLSN